MKKLLLLASLFLVLQTQAQIRHMFDTISYDLRQRPRAFFLSLDGKTASSGIWT
jgi:hypothetical protein